MTITLDLRPYLQMTQGQMFDFCARHPELRIERTAEGELVIMPPTGGGTGHRNSLLNSRLQVWSEASGLGLIFDSSTGFILPNGAQRSPDASWVARERWEALTEDQRVKFVPLCPDFVVELMSPSDSLVVLRAKLEEYRANGARLGWLLNPQQCEVEVYRPGQPVEVLQKPTQLLGEDVLPGLSLSLQSIL